MIKNDLKGESDIIIRASSIKEASLEAVISRGDRRLSRFLESKNILKSLSQDEINYYLYKERALEEILPWDIIDAGINKSFLISEYKKCLESE